MLHHWLRFGQGFLLASFGAAALELPDAVFVEDAAFRDSGVTWQKLDDLCHRGQSTALETSCMNELTNAADEPENQHESTYALLMRSEEKGRNLFEMVIYPLLIISAIIAICQFTLQAVELPPRDTKAAKRVTSVNCFPTRIPKIGIWKFER